LGGFAAVLIARFPVFGPEVVLPVKVQVTGAHIRGNIYSNCAHSCRYCPISRKQSPIALDRYEKLVMRFREWERTSGRFERPGGHLPGYQYNYDRATLDMMSRLDGPMSFKGLSLGGLPRLDDRECRSWLQNLLSYGVEHIHATLAGVDDLHDHWNGKPGNFQSIMRYLRVAGELGIARWHRLLLSKGTLPQLEQLIERLDRLSPGGADFTHVSPFFYQSIHQRAQPQVEAERIDEEIRDSLPAPINGLMTKPEGRQSDLSEREWIEHLRSQPARPYEVDLWIRVNQHSIDYLEATPIEDIIANLERSALDAYSNVPPADELRERFGDPDSRLIYNHQTCVEKLWLDRFRQKNADIKFDQGLTHFWFGG
jgi:hypothetical protein